ncbi:NAD(+) diphosphatase [Heliophilum fasciatum]|uniref:NAD(+) diphosphatase n=1 Tax=Heliophilum fasciatum TaxID=35700 RepID=A0A4V2SY31_9FIRM|nr:NAD(+) diphosphatase [Heliophilum fasciatum]MCW2276938.1 NAD+ diphosphatase [Heliophilum fasciatum]TCP68536.1 NAD+ diphosphatase [Heliophilum fasciatum]
MNKTLPSSRWFLFHNRALLIKETDEGARILTDDDLCTLDLAPDAPQRIGSFDGRDCWVASVNTGTAPAGFAFRELRQVHPHLTENDFALAMRAFHILHWLTTHRFCGCCGHPLRMSVQEIALQCPHCGHSVYPRISPAIIVAVTKGDQILLARANRHPAPPWYSVIAGFLEPGETLEECVRREVKEETGIDVDHIKYFGSQPWPFPDSLMVGFTAKYAGGDICIDPVELLEAGWFSAGDLPALPSGFSIAKKLIDDFVTRHRH